MKRRKIISITLTELHEQVSQRKEKPRTEIEALHGRAEKLLSSEENSKIPDNLRIREIKCLKLALKDELERRGSRLRVRLLATSDKAPYSLAAQATRQVLAATG